MLYLKQIQQPFEVLKCKLSNEFIQYGDFYYEDDVDGVIVKFEVYKKIQNEARDNAFDYSLLEKAQSEKEYKDMMIRAEKDYLNVSILDRQIAEKGQVFDTGLGNRG